MSTNETHVTIKGRLCADPLVFTTKAGAPMTKFRVAQSGRRQVQPGQWEDTEPSFYDVLAYRSLAANIGVSLKKGHPVTVHGRQRVVQWRRDDGQVFVNVEIEADAVGHDLTFGTTAFARVGMGRPAEAWSPGDGGAPQDGRSDDDTGSSAGLGDPENDPFVVEGGLGRGLGEVGFGTSGEAAGPGESSGEASPLGSDSGPLVRPGKEAPAA
ncbi:MAG: single-stranded DNA-binding protein [Ornithinibacter sp.]